MEEREFLERYDYGDTFSEREIGYIVDNFKEVDEIEGRDHRWQREIKTIVEATGRFFAIDWMRGLTENQEHEYLKQPYEVELVKKTVTRVVKEWVSKKEEY